MSLAVKGSVIEFLVDTGSPITVLHESKARDLGLQISPSSLAVRSYSGHDIKIIGSSICTLTDADKGRSCEVDIVIVGVGKPILGMDALNKLNVLSISSLSSPASKSATLHRNNVQVTPQMIYRARSLPFAKRVRVEEELRHMLKEGIIAPASNPVVAAPIVPVAKSNGDVRVCGDYQLTANKLIDAGSYHLPSFEEIAQQLSKFRVFSKLDLERAYLQVPLDSDSQALTTISTPIGYFNFTRLPFGVSAAPRIFQHFIDGILSDLEGVFAFQDDILVGSVSQEAHDRALEQVYERLRVHNLTVSKDKCVLSSSSVKFLGYIVSANKVSPDPERLKSFQEIQSPRSKQQLRSVIDTLQYYSLFVKDFSAKAAVMFSLLKKDCRFRWTPEAESSLRLINSDIVKTI